MLTLQEYKRTPGGVKHSSTQPPKYIFLEDCTTVGRGYGNNIQLLIPWLSRQQIKISVVDSDHFLEVIGKASVFVNQHRVTCAVLKDFDVITFTTKTSAVWRKLPRHAEPIISYYYKHTRDNVPDMENACRSPTCQSDLIILSEESDDGGVLNVTYHVEYFNCTPENSEHEDLSSQEPDIIEFCDGAATNINYVVGAAIGNTNDTSHHAVTQPSGDDLELSVQCTKQSRFNEQIEAEAVPGPSNAFKTCFYEQLRPGTSMGMTNQIHNNDFFSAYSQSDLSGVCTSSGYDSDVEKEETRQFKRKYVFDNEDSLADDDSEQENRSWKLATKNNSASKVGIGINPRKRKAFKGKSKGSCRQLKKTMNRWKRPNLSIPWPRMVNVWSGQCREDVVAFKDTDIFKVEYKCEIQKNEQDVDVKVTANMALLEYKLRCDLLSPCDLQCIFKIVRQQSWKTNIGNFDMLHGPDADIVKMVQPSGIALPLKQYQLKTVAWMSALEKHVDTPWLASRLVKWEGVKCNLLFDLNKERIYLPPLPLTEATSLKVHAKGGILADEMGLGKTITMLGLIASHTANDFPQIPEPDGFDSQAMYRLPCWTTLVVAPSHLTAQWKHEIEKHAADLKVLLITTKPQFEKLSYLDILQTDIVVISVQFLLTNKAYTTMATGTKAETSFINLMRKPGINPLLSKAPNLCHFEWWRIVCDEGHELLTYDKRSKYEYDVEPSIGLKTLENLHARHRWYVTGTPFPHQYKSLQAALKFLDFSVDDPTLMNRDGSLRINPMVCGDIDDAVERSMWPLWQLVRQKFYVRHTKEYVCGECVVPEYIEELLLLTMSDVERGIYDNSTNELERRQLCCHLQIASRIQHFVGVQQKTLDEVRVALIEHTQDEIHHTETSIFRFKEDTKKARTELANEARSDVRTILHDQIKQLGERLVQYGTDIVKLRGALSYFESIMPKITHFADEPCVICLETIESLTVTPCGHLFCRKCILPCITQNSSCPTCRNPVEEKQLIEVKDDSMREEVNKNAEVRKLTEQYGTKMAYLIFYLKHLFHDNPTSRVIIFSQWDPMLHKIGETLNESGLKNVFVKGNVHVRNKAIMSFRKQENVRVIMLSLEHAASGTNLVEATHVILIDPVADTKARAVAIESQAIGRAHRMGQTKKIVVVRMIIEDTIEHELYMRNNDRDVRHVEINFDDESAFGGSKIVRTVRAIPKPGEVSISTGGPVQSPVADELTTLELAQSHEMNPMDSGDVDDELPILTFDDVLLNMELA